MALSAAKVRVRSLSARSMPDGYAVVSIELEVRDQTQLTSVINKLGQIQSVYQVRRASGQLIRKERFSCEQWSPASPPPLWRSTADHGAISHGFLVLLGVAPHDTEQTAVKLADKVCHLRVFEDENGKMNLDLQQVGGSLLVVSQFTLFADCKSRRPGFTGAARPDVAIPLYERFMARCRKMDSRWNTANSGRT